MPYTQNWGISRNAFQSPLNHVNTAGSSDHTHNGKPHPQATNIIGKNNEKANIQNVALLENYDSGPTLIGGGAMGLIGGGIKGSIKMLSLAAKMVSPSGPKHEITTKFDPKEIEKFKYDL